MTKSLYISTSLIAIGIVIVGCSFAWKSIAREEWLWTNDDASEYAEAVAELHTLPGHTHEHTTTIASKSGGKPDSDAHEDSNTQAIIERYDTAQQQLARVRRIRNAGGIVRTVGAICTMVGLAWRFSITHGHA
jgi:hypothetical protein